MGSDSDGTKERSHSRKDFSCGSPIGRQFQPGTITLITLFDSNAEQAFEPISIEQAPVLLPIVNVPLIEYTFEWLAANEVDEVRHCRFEIRV